MTGSLDRNAPSMNRILIAGGHERITGGLEIFISRARACLDLESHVFTDTPGRGGVDELKAAGMVSWKLTRSASASTTCLGPGLTPCFGFPERFSSGSGGVVGWWGAV